MSERDELAALLLPLIGGTYTARDTVPAIADAILARWRLVPVERVPGFRPLLSERYGSDNPGTTAAERNLFASGALWAGERAEKIVYGPVD